MRYALLAVSVCFEVLGTTMLKMSNGFTVLLPSLAVVAAYAVSFSLAVKILEKMPLGLVYGIWGGAGAALTTIIGIVVWNDPFGLSTGLGLVLVVAGIVFLGYGSRELGE
jgi:multidrug transporter EmrE-like cation transporter